MRIQGKHYRTIWVTDAQVRIIDQRLLPFAFSVETISTAEEMTAAIRDMHVRGAPLIGVAGAFGVYLAAKEISKDVAKPTPTTEALFHEKVHHLLHSRPTAVNLAWAIEQTLSHYRDSLSWEENAIRFCAIAEQLADDDVKMCQALGEHGLKLLKDIAAQKKNGEPVRILTHCNAGWLATVDYGTATAPIYMAARAGIPLEVWVDETRPRLQGAKLTSYELQEEGISVKLIADNTAGHIMQRGLVDICIVGSDRTTRTGDVANKIGTYTKALAAQANRVPFYVALPSSTIDWNARDGMTDIPIEQRSADEVTCISGELLDTPGKVVTVRICPSNTPATNFAFDVTPAHLVTGIITERGIAETSEQGLLKLFPERIGKHAS